MGGTGGHWAQIGGTGIWHLVWVVPSARSAGSRHSWGGCAPPRTPCQRDAGGRTPGRMGCLFRSPLGLVVSAARGCRLWVAAGSYTLTEDRYRYVLHHGEFYLFHLHNIPLSQFFWEDTYNPSVLFILFYIFSPFPVLSLMVPFFAYIHPHISFF